MLFWATVALGGGPVNVFNTVHTVESTYILEDWLPLLPGADGVGASHDHTLRADTQVLAVSRLQGYPATARTMEWNSTEPLMIWTSQESRLNGCTKILACISVLTLSLTAWWRWTVLEGRGLHPLKDGNTMFCILTLYASSDLLCCYWPVLSAVAAGPQAHACIRTHTETIISIITL